MLNKIINLLLKLASYTFISLLKVLPSNCIFLLSIFLAFLFKIFATKEIKTLKKNIHMIFGLPPHSNFNKMFVKQYLQHQTNFALESLKIIFNCKKPTIKNFETYKKHIKQLTAEKKSILFVTAHIGSWELLAKYTAQALDDTLYVLAKPAPYKAFTDILNYLRELMNLKVLWINSKTLQKDMIKLIHNNKSIGFVMDQKPLGNKGFEVSFFNRSCEFVKGPALLSKLNNTHIIASFLIRESAWIYKIIFQDIDKTQYQKPEQLTQAIAHVMETVIKLYPEQWTWNYKRWKFN